MYNKYVNVFLIIYRFFFILIRFEAYVFIKKRVGMISWKLNKMYVSRKELACLAGNSIICIYIEKSWYDFLETK